MAAICEASHTKLLLQLIVNFGLFFIFFYWVLMVQQACLRWEGRVEEEMNCQSVFSLAWWDTCSVRPALIEFLTDCLIWSSTKLSLMGFNTCGMRNMQRNKKKKWGNQGKENINAYKKMRLEIMKKLGMLKSETNWHELKEKWVLLLR